MYPIMSRANPISLFLLSFERKKKKEKRKKTEKNKP